MAIAAREEGVRACSECAEIKLLTDFRRRYRDRPDRLHMCNFCHAARERRRRARKRSQRDGMRLQKYATAFCVARDHNRRRLVTEIAIQQFGGFGRFLRWWDGAVSVMVSARQYSPRQLRMCELLWELSLEQDRRRRAALADASDQDLKALIDERLDAWIEGDPEMVLVAASRLGWTVTPPPDSNQSVDISLSS